MSAERNKLSELEWLLTHQMRYNLAVAPCAVRVLPREPLLELFMVVDLAVHRYNDAFVLAVKGLVARRGIDDRQPLMSQEVVPAVVNAAPVGPSVTQPSRKGRLESQFSLIEFVFTKT